MQNMLEQGPDFWCWFDTTQFSYIPLCSPNTCKYVFNPNVTTFQSNCAEGLHFSAFIFSVLVIKLCTNINIYIYIYIYILYRSQHNMWSDVIIQLCKLYSYVNTGGVYRHTLESGGLERICRGKSF